jgi:hypothetical protein
MKKSIFFSPLLFLFFVTYAQVETEGPLKITTNFGYTQVGPVNSGFSHFVTDRPIYYFNKPITVNGAIGSYSADLQLQAARSTKMTITTEGNVGIGTSDPKSAKLYVAGKTDINGSTTSDMFTIVNSNANIANETDLIWGAYSGTQSNNPRLLSLTSGTSYRFAVRNNGQVGINCNPSATSNYMLSVNGDILCERVKVIADVPASDYVFDENYKLMKLNELEKYIKTNSHLPEVPSAQEFKENGYNLGTMDDILLRKIEELTLYIIELKKENEILKKDVESLKNK